jgi:hypothetical protein
MCLTIFPLKIYFDVFSDSSRKKFMSIGKLHLSLSLSLLIPSSYTSPALVRSRALSALPNLTKICWDEAKVLSGGVYKSVSDDRDYLTYILDNKLQVLIIQDKETLKSAACLDVHVVSNV